MTVNEIMDKLAGMGSLQIKQIFERHGVIGSCFGVKVADIKTLVKYVKKDQALALALYDTGNYEAMYLAGLAVDPKLMTKEQLQQWVIGAHSQPIAEYTVAWVTAESAYARELALEWMDSNYELIATCGWSTYANYISVAPDEALDMDEIRSLLQRVRNTIHSERNRVRYTMNLFVISVGAFVKPLFAVAIETAEAVGKVQVNMGNTACKVPLAADYIRKIEEKGKAGRKKKTCIC